MANKEKNTNVKSKRKWWFRILKKIMKIRYKKPEFIYLGKEMTSGALMLSNHEGTDAPLSFEIYGNKPIRFWGSYQMNSGLRKLYGYQTKVYYHEKKHWNLFLARLFCLIASPLTNIFYKGLNLISTYPDARFYKTIKESEQAIKNGENIIIFPEKSNEGYKEILDGFYGGFILLCEKCLKNGYDIPIYISYFNKNKKIYLIDKPILFSQLTKKYNSREEITEKLCDRCNELGELIKNTENIEDLKKLK